MTLNLIETIKTSKYSPKYTKNTQTHFIKKSKNSKIHIIQKLEVKIASSEQAPKVR